MSDDDTYGMIPCAPGARRKDDDDDDDDDHSARVLNRNESDMEIDSGIFDDLIDDLAADVDSQTFLPLPTPTENDQDSFGELPELPNIDLSDLETDKDQDNSFGTLPEPEENENVSDENKSNSLQSSQEKLSRKSTSVLKTVDTDLDLEAFFPDVNELVEAEQTQQRNLNDSGSVSSTTETQETSTNQQTTDLSSSKKLPRSNYGQFPTQLLLSSGKTLEKPNDNNDNNVNKSIPKSMHDEPVVYGRRDDDDPNNTSSYTVFPTGIAETRKKQKDAERSGAASPRRVLSPNRDVLKTLVERKQLIGTDAGERVAATIGNQDSIDNVVLYLFNDMLLFGKKAESGVAGARRALLENVSIGNLVGVQLHVTALLSNEISTSSTGEPESPRALDVDSDGERAEIKFSFESNQRAEEWRVALQGALDKHRKKQSKEKKPSMMRRIASKFSSKKSRESYKKTAASKQQPGASPPVIPESWRPVFEQTGVTDDLLNDPAAFEYILAAVDEWSASAAAKPVPLPPPDRHSKRRQTTAPVRASRAESLRASDPTGGRHRGESTSAVVEQSKSLDTPTIDAFPSPSPSSLSLQASSSTVSPPSSPSTSLRRTTTGDSLQTPSLDHLEDISERTLNAALADIDDLTAFSQADSYAEVDDDSIKNNNNNNNNDNDKNNQNTIDTYDDVDVLDSSSLNNVNNSNNNNNDSKKSNVYTSATLALSSITLGGYDTSALSQNEAKSRSNTTGYDSSNLPRKDSVERQDTTNNNNVNDTNNNNNNNTPSGSPGNKAPMKRLNSSSSVAASPMASPRLSPRSRPAAPMPSGSPHSPPVPRELTAPPIADDADENSKSDAKNVRLVAQHQQQQYVDLSLVPKPSGAAHAVDWPTVPGFEQSLGALPQRMGTMDASVLHEVLKGAVTSIQHNTDNDGNVQPLASYAAGNRPPVVSEPPPFGGVGTGAVPSHFSGATMPRGRSNQSHSPQQNSYSTQMMNSYSTGMPGANVPGESPAVLHVKQIERQVRASCNQALCVLAAASPDERSLLGRIADPLCATLLSLCDRADSAAQSLPMNAANKVRSMTNELRQRQRDLQIQLQQFMRGKSATPSHRDATIRLIYAAQAQSIALRCIIGGPSSSTFPFVCAFQSCTRAYELQQDLVLHTKKRHAGVSLQMPHGRR